MTTQNITEISHENIIANVLKLKHEGYRLVQICATMSGEDYDIVYSFAKEYEFVCLRTIISQDIEIPSISSVYPPSFLYENEMKDLFGVKIFSISIDYNGNFYRLDTKTPFKPENTSDK